MKTFLVKRPGVASYVHFCASRNDLRETPHEFEALRVKGWDEEDARTTLNRDFGQDEAGRMELAEV